MSIENILIEKLADAEHASWSSWMRYLFSKCIPHKDGSMTIPSDLVEHWTIQLNTEYSDLSEAEKEADRAEVRKILPYIQHAFASINHEDHSA